MLCVLSGCGMAGTPSGDGSSIVRMVCLGKMLPSVGVTPCF
jgi:hypothetical protein